MYSFSKRIVVAIVVLVGAIGTAWRYFNISRKNDEEEEEDMKSIEVTFVAEKNVYSKHVIPIDGMCVIIGASKDILSARHILEVEHGRTYTEKRTLDRLLDCINKGPGTIVLPHALSPIMTQTYYQPIIKFMCEWGKVVPRKLTDVEEERADDDTINDKVETLDAEMDDPEDENDVEVTTSCLVIHGSSTFVSKYGKYVKSNPKLPFSIIVTYSPNTRQMQALWDGCRPWLDEDIDEDIFTTTLSLAGSTENGKNNAVAITRSRIFVAPIDEITQVDTGNLTELIADDQ